jgi:hypothetical protein
VPIIFGGSPPTATLTLSGIPELLAGKKIRCELIHPGETQWQNCEFTRSESRITQILGKERGSVNMLAVAIEKTGSQINY